jgi:hypothetical protein
MSKGTVELTFGAMAQPLSEQLSSFALAFDTLEQYQKDADAITRLNIRGMLGDSHARAARDKLMKRICKSISEKQQKGAA